MIGDVRILYFYHDSAWTPVGCVTGSDLSESVQMSNVSTRDDGDYAQFIPMAQTYSISVSGVTTLTGTIVTVQDLRDMLRARNLIQWKIEDTDGGDTYTGAGYITTVTEDAPAGNYVTFSCTLEGSADIKTT